MLDEASGGPWVETFPLLHPRPGSSPGSDGRRPSRSQPWRVPHDRSASNRFVMAMVIDVTGQCRSATPMR
jgi:hypothetical protein